MRSARNWSQVRLLNSRKLNPPNLRAAIFLQSATKWPKKIRWTANCLNLDMNRQSNGVFIPYFEARGVHGVPLDIRQKAPRLPLRGRPRISGWTSTEPGQPQ